MIEVKNVSKSFNETRAVKSFSFKFPSKGMIALCGLVWSNETRYWRGDCSEQKHLYVF